MVQAKPPGAVSTGGNEVVVAIIIPQEEESLGKALRVPQGRLKGNNPTRFIGAVAVAPWRGSGTEADAQLFSYDLFFPEKLRKALGRVLRRRSRSLFPSGAVVGRRRGQGSAAREFRGLQKKRTAGITCSRKSLS